uniref:ARAD1D46640p n=1 Tax=Blastobotrys adeninivorans TaxID=409370 RepID=A0A060TCY4_BLAAD
MSGVSGPVLGGAATNNPSQSLASSTNPSMRVPGSMYSRRASLPTGTSSQYPVLYPVHRIPSDATIPPEQESLIPDIPRGMALGDAGSTSTPNGQPGQPAQAGQVSQPGDGQSAQSKVEMKRYATSVDERNFLTVYEYMVNGQWVIWDYYTGYVHLTGLWKAVGNSKADIVKLVDNSPHLEPVIRRVRGGFLKIQGTWLPFNVARTLASRTCFHIRYALIPLFGPDFPNSCLKPGDLGFGQLQLHVTPGTKRRRRSTASGSQSGPGSALSNLNNNSNNNGPSPKKRRQSDNLDRPGPAHMAFGMPSPPPIAPKPLLSQVDSVGPLRRHTFSASSYSLLSPTTRSVKLYENAIDDSSEEEAMPHARQQQRQQHQKLAVLEPQVRPPPLPNRLDFPNQSTLLDSPSEFAQVLQATRSLQQMSAGKYGRRWSTSSLDLGGGFECGGKLWRWDGRSQLQFVGEAHSQEQAERARMESRQLLTSQVNDSPPTPPDYRPPEKVATPKERRGVMDISGLLS